MAAAAAKVERQRLGRADLPYTRRDANDNQKGIRVMKGTLTSWLQRQATAAAGAGAPSKGLYDLAADSDPEEGSSRGGWPPVASALIDRYAGAAIRLVCMLSMIPRTHACLAGLIASICIFLCIDIDANIIEFAESTK